MSQPQKSASRLQLDVQDLALTEIERRTFNAVGCIPTFKGAALAARRVARCLELAFLHFPVKATPSWFRLAELTVVKLNKSAETNTSLLLFDQEIHRDRVYGQFVHGSAPTLGSSELEIVDGAMGVVLINHIQAGRTVSPALISAWTRLRKCGSHRRGRHPDWEKLANSFPTTPLQIADWLSKDSEPDLINFLKAVEPVLRTRPLSPDDVEADIKRLSQSDTHSDSHSQKTGDDATKKEETSDRNVPTPPESFCGWLGQRANQSGYISHFGISGRWEKQSKDEIKHLCKRIASAFEGNFGAQKFALFAILSLKTSLPANLLVNVSTRANSDIWFDVNNKCIQWCILRLTNLERAKASKNIERHNFLDIWLPQLASPCVDQLMLLHPDAETVQELILGATEEDKVLEFIDDYRAWLTSNGIQSKHLTYDARIARSLGQFYRQKSNDIVAAAQSLDFEESAIGTLHYTRFLRQHLYHISTEISVELGLGTLVQALDLDSKVGSTKAVDFDAFIHGLRRLTDARNQKLNDMKCAKSAEEAALAFNSICHMDQLLVLSLSAGRSSHLARMTWANVMGHPQYILLGDKDIEKDEYSKYRVVPKHTALKNVLNAHAEAKAIFARVVQVFGVVPHSPRGLKIDDKAPHRVFFACAKLTQKDGKTYVARTAVDTIQLKELATEYLNGHLNCGRHSIISKLLTIKNLDPWLLKSFTSHHRGHAEPFADGMCIPPKSALKSLSRILNDLFQPYTEIFALEIPDHCLHIGDFKGKLPTYVLPQKRRNGARTRVLVPAFDSFTFISLRLVDHLIGLLENNEGPTHEGARLLLGLMLQNWIGFDDQKVLWADGAIEELNQETGVAVWTRPGCRAVVRITLEPAPLIALGNLGHRNLRKKWHQACSESANWLKFQLPKPSWPDFPEDTLRALSTLLARWLRFHLPPFELAAASPSLTSPTLTNNSLARLMAQESVKPLVGEQLLFPKPTPRGKSNLKFAKSKLQEAIALIHDFASPQKNFGEDWERYKNLKSEAAKLDCSSDFSAQAVIVWIDFEAELWIGSKRGRIQLSSFSTYIYSLAVGFVHLTPIHNLRLWSALEWEAFEELLRSPPGTKKADNTEERINERVTAAKRFVAALRAKGWDVPNDLFEDIKREKADGMRNSACSVLLLNSDRERLRNLLTLHFNANLLDSSLAGFYSDLRQVASLRSLEAAVLPIDGLDPFDGLTVTTDGFSHLKSDNARRTIEIPLKVAQNYRELATSLKAAHDSAKWMFLANDRSDWRFIVQLETAFSAALKQITQDESAVPHLTRATAPLNYLLPGWEKMLRDHLQGCASVADYNEFIAKVEGQGFTNLVQILIQIGHGHPLTYLKYYYALWDLVMSVYCRANTLERSNISHLVTTQRPHLSQAFKKERQRSANQFNATSWIIRRELKSLNLPKFQHSHSQIQNFAPILDLPSNAKPTLNAVNALYIAARYIDHDVVAASKDFDVDSNTVSSLECMFSSTKCSRLTDRHQGKISQGGKKAEIKYLKSPFGLALAKALIFADIRVLASLGESLTPIRTYMGITPSASSLHARFKNYLKCLPESLGLLIQFNPNKYSPAEVLEIHGSELRLSIGMGDPDLGSRPRVFVVDVHSPQNLVTRARRTSNTRCLIAAIQLFRQE